MTTHVTHGKLSNGALEELERHARSGRGTTWTIPSGARPGDTAVFYILEPLGLFVATGQVRRTPRLQPAGRPWAGHHMELIRDIRMLGMFCHRRAVAADVPGWGWLRAPRREATVPVEQERALLAALGAPQGNALLTGQVEENILREARWLRRSRNRAVRDRLVQASGGVCAACRTDYRTLVPGLWTSLLVGHHLDPLAATDEPVLTDASRLAAVCPTCHRMLDLDPSRPMTPRQLRAQLARGRVTGPTRSGR